MNKTNKLTTKDYYVAHIDILGAKKFMEKDNEHKFLNDLNDIYITSLEQYNKINNSLPYDITIKIFSDNILLGVPLDALEDYNKAKIETIINLAGLIQLNAFKKSYLCRGAITKGKFFQNELFVFGSGLVNSYTLETNNAIYPRIIIQRCNIYNTKRVYICPSNDDFYYINYYFFSLIENFDTFKTILLNLLKQYRNDEKIKQKIMWSIHYHNDYFKEELNPHKPTNPPYIIQEEILDVLLK